MTIKASPNRVLVLWADNHAANYGLRVLAEGNARLIRRAFGEEVNVDWQDFGPGDSVQSFGTRAIFWDVLKGKRGAIKTKLRQYDLVVDSGAGDSFADIYGLKRLAFIAYAHHCLRRLRIPLVLAPQTIGPFDTRIGRAVARKSVKQATAVMARDDESARYSHDVLGRPVDAVATDVVFFLDSEKVQSTRDVVINVSGLLWFANSHVDFEFYRKETVRLVRELVDAGRQVSLLAHVVHSPSGNDDVDAIEDAITHVGLGDSVELLIPSSLREARQFLASASIVVGGRMHACLNAMSQGVPAIPWAYSRKFEPLLAGIGWPTVVDLRTVKDPAENTLGIILNEARLSALNTDIEALNHRVPRATTYSIECLARVHDGEIANQR